MKPNSILLAFIITLLPTSELVSAKKHSLLPTSTIESSCFEPYYGLPGDLLTFDLLDPLVDFEGEDPSFSTVPMSNKDYATTNCKWYINKKRRIIRLQSIRKVELLGKTAVERFYEKYHTKTKSELEETKSTYKSEVEDKSDVDNANVIGDAMDFNFEYLEVNKLGDAAVWEHKVNDLIVLVGEYQFTVNVKLGGDNALNLEKAELIAHAIIDKACK